MNPHKVTKDFEAALCAYTGAPYAVAVTSCTMALTLAVAWHLRRDAPMTATLLSTLRNIDGRPRIEIPKRTYVGVPYAIRDAGGEPTFRHESWRGLYQLKPLSVWDSARWFTSEMFSSSMYWVQGHRRAFVCVSFHASKILGDTQGGAILHDDPEADAWLRRARFDGRTEGVPPAEDDFDLDRAWHCYLSPDVSARLLWHLSVLPKRNDPLPNDDYPDLSLHKAFQ